MAGGVGGDRGAGGGRRLGHSPRSSAPFALSLSKPVLSLAKGGLFAVVEVFAELLTVGRGLPGGKFLSLSRQRKEPKKGAPDSPEFPKIKRAEWAAKNSPRL